MFHHALELVGVVAIGYAIYKHYGAAVLLADVKASVAKAEATVATIKADLAKYL
jgi:hypothetical protein